MSNAGGRLEHRDIFVRWAEPIDYRVAVKSPEFPSQGLEPFSEGLVNQACTARNSRVANCELAILPSRIVTGAVALFSTQP